ncbi:MAG: peptidase S15, partial [Thaumarchaeota archaeon]|nr:peptidase S15 [Nitrososphaerota archaeon]
SQAEQKIEYEALGDGLTFFSAPLEEETEITGPSAAKLFVSSSTTDADLFLVLRVFDPKGKEVVFQGALDPHTPIAQGWLRASHRKLDNSLSTPYRPYHSHDALEPLVPDKIYELDVEIWPTCIVVPKGYKISFTVRGKDYEYSGETDRLTTFANEFKGCGPFIHTDPRDRPESVFGGKTTLHSRNSFVLLPIIPKKSS